MASRWYKLASDGRTPIACDVTEADGHIGHHVGDDERDGIRVSTAFLGLDHQFGSGPPLLWETMVFGLEDDEPCERYSSYEDAVAGHQRYVNEHLHGAPQS